MFVFLLFAALRSLAVTIVLELFACFLCGIRDIRRLELIVLANVATNPVVSVFGNIVPIFIGFKAGFMFLLLLEILAWLLEGWIYAKRMSDLVHPFRLSLLANGISFGTGLVLNALHFIF